MLGPGSILVIQVCKGFDVPLETVLPVVYVAQTYYRSTRNRTR
jgi:hypothetical protein